MNWFECNKNLVKTRQHTFMDTRQELILAFDSTGLKLFSEGEWKARNFANRKL